MGILKSLFGGSSADDDEKNYDDTAEKEQENDKEYRADSGSAANDNN